MGNYFLFLNSNTSKWTYAILNSKERKRIRQEGLNIAEDSLEIVLAKFSSKKEALGKQDEFTSEFGSLSVMLLLDSIVNQKYRDRNPAIETSY